MINQAKTIVKPDITNFEMFVKLADYSLMDTFFVVRYLKRGP